MPGHLELDLLMCPHFYHTVETQRHPPLQRKQRITFSRLPVHVSQGLETPQSFFLSPCPCALPPGLSQLPFQLGRRSLQNGGRKPGLPSVPLCCACELLSWLQPQGQVWPWGSPVSSSTPQPTAWRGCPPQALRAATGPAPQLGNRSSAWPLSPEVTAQTTWFHDGYPMVVR